MIDRNEIVENIEDHEALPRRILVVEDDDGLRNLILKSLRKAGYEADGVGTGTDALDRVMADPDLALLLDQKLPDMSGNDIINALSEKGRRVSFVVMTGQGDERLAVEMMKLGAADYLVKTLELVDLLPEIFQRLFRELDNERRLRATEARLRASEAKCRGYLENCPDGVFIADEKGRYIEVNKAACLMTGYSEKELLQTSISDLLSEEYLEFGLTSFRRLIETGVSKGESQFRHKDGSKRWWFVDAVKLSQTRYLGFTKDITERKQAEASIRESEEKFSRAFEKAPLLMTISSITDGTYIDVNDKFMEVSGFKREETIGKTSVELGWLQSKDRDLLIQELKEKGSIGGVELELEAKDKRKVFCLYHGEIINIGGRQRLLSIAQDITDRNRVMEEKRSLEERLMRAEKMEALGTLAGGVAHDLNNVLGIVVGYAEMLLDEIDESSPLRKDLTTIMESGHRSAAIVHDLLTLARRGVQSRKVINLNATIMDCQKTPEFEKALSFSQKVRIITDLEADMLNIMGSPVHLGKTIFNLVSNALEAMHGQGTLTIKTYNQYLDRPIYGYDTLREGDYAVVSVSDTGEGIPAKDIRRIFEPFYTKKIMGRSGTGLGLAVVWGTVKDHNGYINVESEEGKGSTFTLYFPITREDVDADMIRVSMSEYMGKGESILVVDDIKGQRELVSRMLSKLNYQVTTVGSGEESVEYLKASKADLIVMDMIMDPGIDGLETYQQILKFNPLQKAIIVSGFSESDRVKQAQRLGIGAYLKKPYVIEKFALAVRKELDKK